ncbi:MAG: type II secretion system GspH family protein [Defluviitaleaceae bacterium]|nr:type II secretion system GspH family protein [Defluviitaleaceae bacterium]
MKNIAKKRNKGFSLVELIVVISIMLVLSVLAVVAFSQIADSARLAAERSDASAVARSLNTFNALANAGQRYEEKDDIPTTTDTFTIVHDDTTGVMPIVLSVTVTDADRLARVLEWLVEPNASGDLWTVLQPPA